MTSEPGRRLQAALAELANVQPPAGLADAALTRAHRQRRREVAGAVLATLIAVTATAVGARVALQHRASPAAAAPVQQPRYLVAAYVSYSGQHGGDALWVLDRSAGRYVRTPFSYGVAAPDGRRLLVTDPRDEGRYGLISLGDAAHGNAAATVWVWRNTTRYVVEPRWSPDGHELLRPAGDAHTLTGLVLIDAATGRSRQVNLAGGAYQEGGPLPDPVWGPDGDSVVVLLIADPRLHNTPSARVFGLDGRLRTTLRLTGTVGVDPGDPAPHWSPDGRTLATARGDLLDIASGQVRTINRPSATTTPVLGWYDATHLLWMDLPRTGARTELQILDLRNQTISGHVQLGDADATAVLPSLIRLTGPAPQGAHAI